MRYLFTTIFLALSVLALPAKTQAATYQNHWTKCVLSFGPKGGFQSKACYKISMPREHRQRIGHRWWIDTAHSTARQQVRITYPTFAPPPPPPVDMGSRAIPCAWGWRGFIQAASTTYGVPTRVIAATLCTESTGVNIGCNVSTDGYGSEGLMQLIPSTAAYIMGVSVSYATTALCDPGWNIMAGAAYLLYQYRIFGYDWRNAAGAYNAGSWINYAYLTKWPYGWDYYYG